MIRRLWNLWRYGRWTDCTHPPEELERFGWEGWRCRKCGALFYGL